MNSQEIRAIREAYNQVYEQETGRGPRISDTYDMRDAEGGPKGGRTIKGPKMKNVIRKEEIDLFDYILEHLVAEGFADTNESALAIMANMSEEWRESIVEKYATFGYNADDPGDDFGQFVDKGPKTNKQKRNAIQLNNKILSKPGMLKGV
jgi:hypothetical protein